jgi:hypothetical protein
MGSFLSLVVCCRFGPSALSNVCILSRWVHGLLRTINRWMRPPSRATAEAIGNCHKGRLSGSDGRKPTAGYRYTFPRERALQAECRADTVI